MTNSPVPDLTPRERRRAARTEAILDAAMRIVIEEGPRGLAMRALATELDLTPGAVYRYFDGKDAIVAALGHRTLGRYARALDAAEFEARALGSAELPDAPAALYALLARIWCFWDLSVTDPGGWRLINLFLVDPRRLITGGAHDRFMAAVAVQIQRVAALSEAAVAAGALAPGNPVQRALIIVANLNGSLQYLKMAESSPVQFRPDQILRGGLDGLLLGWGADPAQLEIAWKVLDKQKDAA